MATTAFVNIVADASRVPDQLTRDLTRAINQVEIRIPPIEIRVQVDTRSVGDAAGQADRAGFSFGNLIGIAAKVTKGLVALTAGVALSTTAIGGLGVAVSSMVSAFGGVSGVVNLAAGAVGVFAAAQTVLKVALIGVSEVIGTLTGDAAAFEEAVAKLSPAAQSVAREFRAAVPAFTGFQQALQEALFSQLEGENVAKRLSGALKEITPNASLVAEAFGGIAAKVVDFLTLDSTIANLNTILAAAAPIVERLGEVFISFAGGALQRAADGTAQFGSAFDTLKAAFDAIKGIASDVGRIFGAITDAAERAGVSLGGPLATGLGLVADLFESPAGKEFLDTMVELAQTLIGTLVPVIGDLLQALAPLIAAIAGELGPVIKALGPPLSTLIEALGSALVPIVEALGPVLVSAAGAIGSLVTALAPLLPVIGNLAAALLPALIPLFDALGKIFVLLAPLALQLGETLTAVLQPILAILPGLVQQLVTPSLELAQVAFPLLTDILIQMTPVWVQLAQILAQILPVLIPIITAATTMATQFISFLAPAIRVVATIVGTLASALLGFVNGVLNAVVIPAIEVISALFRGDFKTAFEGARNIVFTVGNAIIGFFAALPGRAAGALTPIISGVIGIGTRALSGLVRVVSQGFNSALSFVRSFPGRVRGALGGLGGLLFGAGASLIRGFINGIRSMAGAAANAARGVVSSVRNLFPFSPAKEGPFSGRGYTSYSGVALIQGLIDGINKAAPQLQGSLSSVLSGATLTPAIAGAMGSTAGAAATMGQSFNVAPAVNAAPKVSVFIGNKELEGFIDVQVDKQTRATQRQMAQGIRR